MPEAARIVRKNGEGMIKGAVFDFDGTLFDSMGIWDTAGEDYLNSVGCTAKENLQAELKTMSLYQAACYVKKEYGLNKTPEEIMAGVNKVVEDFYFHFAMPKPGAVNILKLLQRHGINMCIATATDCYQVEAALRRCGMRNFFEEILTCTEIGHGKDEPHIFREAINILNTDRTNTLVFEDAYHAIKTAKTDGFTTVAVFDAHEQKQKEILEITDFYLKDYSDLNDFWKFASEK